MSLTSTTMNLAQLGLSALPAIPAEKRPALPGWREYQKRLPTEDETRRWFARAEGVCLVCGAVSGNLEMLDFDNKGELFTAWWEKVEAARPGLFDRLVVEQTPSGGYHVAYRSAEPVPGNQRLAQRAVRCDGPEEVEIGGKRYVPRRNGERWEVTVTLIETRGEGGLFLCDPTPGYSLQQGEFAKLPTLSVEERALLIDTARSLNELHMPENSGSVSEAKESRTIPAEPVDRPGDEFNARADIRPLLIQHGWVRVREGDNEHWRRPGKDTGTSATLKDGVFYVFSTSAAPFEADKGYSPFQVYALLEHGGDFTAAARELRESGFGDEDGDLPQVDLSSFLANIPDPPTPVDEAEAKPLAELFESVTELDPPLIHGLLREGETMNVIASSKMGKALAIDTPILTDTGWQAMGDLQPGMKVHAADGSLTEIVAVSDIMHDRPCYHVQTKSGAWVIADENHSWTVLQGRIKKTVRTRDLPRGYQGRRWLLPTPDALEREKADLPLDPWLLGYWLGNGTAREGALTANRKDLQEVLLFVRQAGYEAGRIRYKSGAATFAVLGLQVKLRGMGMLRNKHIPELYLTASRAQRAALLAGLLDSDGHALTQPNGVGIVEFTTSEELLFFHTLTLIRSLGFKASTSVGRARWNGKDCGHKLRITFAANRTGSPFRFARKTAALPERLLGQRSQRDAVQSVKRVPSVPVKCIQVAHPSGLFLAGRDFIVTHNSWLVMRLAISIASGLDWFGMPVEHGRVLHIDNELRLKTIVHRYRKIAEALKVPGDLFSHNLDVKSLRGRLKDLNKLGSYFASLEPGKYKAIIIDAFYRTLPIGMDENDNGAIASLYNKLDWYASRLQCAFILIHHSSKGNQAQKTVTDVGAGAGAQSRAADTHLILRPHEEANVAVLEAAVRSWPPREPMCLRWEFPLWHEAKGLDPASLQGKEKPRKSGKQEMSVEEFVEECVMPHDPCLQNRIIYEAEQRGLSAYKARNLIALALESGQLVKERNGSRMEYAALREGIPDGKAQLVAARIRHDLETPAQQIADEYGVTKRYVFDVKNQLNKQPPGGELGGEVGKIDFTENSELTSPPLQSQLVTEQSVAKVKNRINAE